MADESVKTALRVGFRYMEAAATQGDNAMRKCFNCHNTSEPLETQLLGTRFGFDAPTLTTRFCAVAQDLHEQAEAAQGPMVVGSNQFRSGASVTIKTLQFLNAFHYPYDITAATMWRFTLDEQRPDGSWGGGPRLPMKAAARVVDIFELAEGWLSRMPADEPQRKAIIAAITRAAKWLPTFDVPLSLPETAPYDEAAQLRGMVWLKRQATASPRIIEAPIDVQAVERKKDALRKSLIAKAKRTKEGTCWEWGAGECDAFVTSANVLAFQTTGTDPELVQDALRWLLAKQDTTTGKWFAKTHSDVQMAADVFLVETAFDAEQLKRIHAADQIDNQKKDPTRQEARKLVRSDPTLQMAIRNDIETSFASAYAMRALLGSLSTSSPNATAGVQVPLSCPPLPKKKENQGYCMRCHSDGTSAPVVFPFAPENTGAWKPALAKDDKKKTMTALARKIHERISLPPDDPNAMPPPDSLEGALFGYEAMGMRRMLTIWGLEDALGLPRSKLVTQQRK